MNKKNKFYIFTLGCQMNIAESQKIKKYFEMLNYKSAPEKEADLVIVNACSVRQKALDRIWGKIKIWKNQNKKIVVTGCVLPQDQKKFSKKDIEVIQNNEFFDISPNIDFRVSKTLAYVPIMTGCDNFCSYCAVPLTRGREKSRVMKDIIFDVKNALENGAKDILLLGQNVNSYKLKTKSSKLKTITKNSKDNADFIELLRTVDDLPYDFKFNFISSNPYDMSAELIECFANLKKWKKELHLAMQSGDDEILKKMNRKYSSSQYLKLIENLKFKIENLSITTDIIVGFPGETKKQFDNTVKLCKKIGFSKAYISQYSPRPGTMAVKLKDDVSATEKKRRWTALNKLIN